MRKICPLLMILLFMLSACGSAPPKTPTHYFSTAASTSVIIDLPQNPTSTLISPPTQTAKPNPEVTGANIIEQSNAAQLTNLKQLGKGNILFNAFYANKLSTIFSPDGSWIAIPTAAGIYIYDSATFEEKLQIPAGMAYIFSPDGSLLAASGRGAVSLWNPSTGDKVGELSGNPQEYYSGVAFSPDGSRLAILSLQREITVWSLETSQSLYTFPGDWLQFSPDGELAVVVLFGENKVHLFETKGGTKINQWNVHSAGFAPGGQLWLEDDQSVRIAYLDREQITAPFTGIQPAFSTDGAFMSLYANSQVWLYDHQKGRRTQILEGSYARVDWVVFSPDGQTVIGETYSLHCPTCSELDGLDHALILWRVEDGSILAKLEDQSPYQWLGFSADGSFFAAVQMEKVQFFKTEDISIVKQIDGFAAPIAGMTLSPNGTTLAAAHATLPYTLRLVDLTTCQTKLTLFDPQVDNLFPVEVAYSADEKFLAVGGDLWNLESGTRLVDLEQKIGEKTSCWPSSAAFSPNKNILTTGCFEGQLDLWSVPDGALLNSFGGYNSWVNGLAYSPDGEYLAAIYGVPDYLVQVWQIQTGKASFSLTGGHFTRVSYSGDGQTLATVAANTEYEQYGWMAGYVQLWSALTGKKIAQLDLDDAVSITFSPNNLILATGSFDGTLRLWEATTGKLLLETKEHYAEIQRLAFIPDGTILVTGSQDGTIRLWGIPSESSPGN